jgi:hypothetical protein
LKKASLVQKKADLWAAKKSWVTVAEKNSERDIKQPKKQYP